MSSEEVAASTTYTSRCDRRLELAEEPDGGLFTVLILEMMLGQLERKFCVV